MMSLKLRSLLFLAYAEVAVMGLWFVSTAILPDLLREVSLSAFQQAALTSSVQIGFVAGALASAVLGLSDRYDPRHVFTISALLAVASNLAMLILSADGFLIIFSRFMTGACLAGVYPVGMKIMVGWGIKDRGLLVGTLVGALTLGSALPHLIAFGGGTDWQFTVILSSALALTGGLVGLLTQLGPHHRQTPKFDATVIKTAWTNKRIRLAYAGYLGHMWELYTMWAWIGIALAVSYGASMEAEAAQNFARLTTFIAIAAGGAACIPAGWFADRIGKENVTIIAMTLSGGSALLTAAAFGEAPWVTFIIVLIWGITIIPDSAQFSALVADASPPDQAGSLMTLQTALGFALTFITVQAAPMLADLYGWQILIAGLALGPAFGVWAMLKLRAMK